MTQLLTLLHRLRWPLVALAIAAAATWVIVVGFGASLGVDPGVRATVDDVTRRAWAGLVTVLLPLILRDADRDGTPDVLQSGPIEGERASDR